MIKFDGSDSNDPIPASAAECAERAVPKCLCSRATTAQSFQSIPADRQQQRHHIRPAGSTAQGFRRSESYGQILDFIFA